MVEDARLCLFGRNISKSDRCSVVILNSKGREKVIAETGFREYGTVACLNGEFFLLLLYNSDCLKIKGHISIHKQYKDIVWHTM